jgi:O-antigen ligase/tetratricopeptide (TPR) repeat protein
MIRTSSAGKPKRSGAALRLGTASLLVHASLVLMLSICAARMFLGETQVRSQLIPLSEAMQARDLASRRPGEALSPRTDRTDLSRASFATLLMGASLLGIIGLAMLDQWKPAWTLLLLAGLAFSVVAWISGMYGRAGPTTAGLAWADAVAPLLAGATMVALCANRRRFALLAGVLSATGVLLAVLGIWQATIEIPQNIAEFEANRITMLERFGFEPGSAQAMQLEARVREVTPAGRFGLANVFASGLLILAGLAAGLTLDRLRAANRTRKAFRLRSPKGEVHPATLLAVLTAIATGAILAVVALTRSLGAIGSCLAGAAAMILIWRLRQALARRWKTAMGLAALAVALTLTATVGYALWKDRLPTRTMTFRWHYWTGGMQALSQEPLLGVGPGGFGQAYLQHRRIQAEEEVKDPHNAIVQGLVEYGVLGGSLRLGLLVGALVLLAAPRRRVSWSPADASPGRGRIKLIAGAGVVVAMGLLHAWFSEGASIIYAGGLALFLVPSLWRIDRSRLAGIRVGLSVALGAFVLHNMVTYSLSFPATATLFWISAGGCIGYARRGSWGQTAARGPTARRWPPRGLAIVLAAGALAIPLAVTLVQIWAPTYQKTLLLDQAIERYVRGQKSACMARVTEAIEAVDNRDELLRYDASRLEASWVPRLYDAAQRAELAGAHGLLSPLPGSSRNASWAGELAFSVGARDYRLMRPLASGDQASIRLEQLREVLATGQRPTPTLLADLAEAHMLLGQYPQAISRLEELLAQRPQCVSARFRKGDVGYLAGDVRQAGNAWRSAAELLAAQATNRASLENADAGTPLQGWMEIALGQYQWAVRLDPFDANLRLRFARCLARAGQYSRALEQIDQAMARNESLEPASLNRISPEQLRQVQALQARCRFLAGEFPDEKDRP